MIVVKNINNNVSICLDSRNKEVVVFGKGVGFIKPPAEIPLSKIERTFYDLSPQYVTLLSDIPAEVVDFTARQMLMVQDQLPYETNSNLGLILADHLAFAMERAKKGIYLPMPSIYEMELNYPLEVKIGRHFVSAMEQEFHIRLPKGEVWGVAMHFINARNGVGIEFAGEVETQFDSIMEQVICIIEHETGIHVHRDTFNFVRFATHMQYLLKRVLKNEHIKSPNLQMYKEIRDEYQIVSACVDKISEYLKNNYSVVLAEEESLYLIMHVNRVCSQEVD
ncbi:MAG: PRD domain-containing protein [Faecousia sp.]